MRYLRSYGICLVLIILKSCESRAPFVFRSLSVNRNHARQLPASKNLLLSIRGGASRNQKTKASQKTATGKSKVGLKDGVNKKEPPTGIKAAYAKMLPLTKIYITMVVLCTSLGLIIGEEMTQSLLALDPIRTVYGFQLWRPFTAASFLGPPSLQWVFNGYYLFQYGTMLERAYGTPQHLIFLFTQLGLLTALNILLGLPFFTTSMITAMLHVLSRSMPYQNVKWLVFSVPYWSLPYGLMATDVLQAQSAAAAIPHILGILTGHFYQFHKFVWPKLERGQDWLVAPDFLVKRLDPNAKDKDDEAAKKPPPKKRKKGRKLGSS